MSAFIVSHEHIDAICAAASTYPDYGLTWQSTEARKSLLKGESLDPIGQMLWHENMVSVSYRYHEDDPSEMPGPTGLTADKLLSYRYRRPKKIPTPVEALKLIHCYAYQSCEHDEWNTSEAKAFCDALEADLIRHVPGYDAAHWGI